MSAQIVIDTSLEDVNALVEELTMRGEGSMLQLPHDQDVSIGTWVEFGVNLASGETAFGGTGLCIDCAADDQGYYMVTLDELRLDDTNTLIFQRVRMGRGQAPDEFQVSNSLMPVATHASIPPQRTNGHSKGAKAWAAIYTDPAAIEAQLRGWHLSRPVFKPPTSAFERFNEHGHLSDSGMYNYPGEDLPVPTRAPRPEGGSGSNGYGSHHDRPASMRAPKHSDVQELDFSEGDVLDDENN